MNYQKYSFDFYLELLNAYYTQIEIKTILEKFQIERVILPESFEKKDYSSVLETIEKDPSFIIKYCSEKDNKEKYKKIFYTILLYFRLNYEKEKDESLLKNKDLNKYFFEILPKNYRYFSILNIHDQFIFEILKQKNLSFETS